MPSSSFYNQNATVYTETNPTGPVDAPLTNVANTASPSSFYKGSSGSLTSLAEANFELAISVSGGVLLSSEWLFGYTFDFTGTFAANLAGSQAHASVPASNPAVLSLRCNGVQFGTLTYSGTTGTFSGTQTTFNPGDLLEVIAPASADPTLAHLSITLVGTRVT